MDITIPIGGWLMVDNLRNAEIYVNCTLQKNMLSAEIMFADLRAIAKRRALAIVELESNRLR